MSEHNSNDTPEERSGPGNDAAKRPCNVRVREAVLASAYAGQPVPVERDGKVVWLQPNEILAEFGLPPLGKKDDTLGAA